jgi:hypothetical protein
MTMLSTEIGIMLWNDHLGLSRYTSYLWISLHGNQVLGAFAYMVTLAGRR